MFKFFAILLVIFGASFASESPQLRHLRNLGTYKEPRSQFTKTYYSSLDIKVRFRIKSF